MHDWKKRATRVVATGGQADNSSTPWQRWVTLDESTVQGICQRVLPTKTDTSLAEVFRHCREDITSLLARQGAVLFRGFVVDGAHGLELLQRWVGGRSFVNREETSPRTQLAGEVFTATEYPPEYEIAFHNESSYQAAMPEMLLFQCEKPSSSGGATVLSDCRAVWRELPESLTHRFASEGYRLVRTYHPHFGLPWQRAFGSSDRSVVNALAERDGIELKWLADDVLTTSQVRPCVARQTVTGSTSWTNHLYFFHHSNLPEFARTVLSGNRSETEFVNDTFYANGEPIARDTLATIGRSYEANAIEINWCAGDVLLVDNIALAHARRTYVGARSLFLVQFGSVEWRDLKAHEETVGETA